MLIGFKTDNDDVFRLIIKLLPEAQSIVYNEPVNPENDAVPFVLVMVTGALIPPPPPEPVFTVIGNVEPSPLVKVIVFELTDAVVKNEPVLIVVLAFKA
jgi:hypothetical protein